MSGLTPEQIQKGKRLLNGATEGPWERTDGIVWLHTVDVVTVPVCCNRPLRSGECCGDAEPGQEQVEAQEKIAESSTADAELIAWMRNHLSDLLNAAEELPSLRAQLAAREQEVAQWKSAFDEAAGIAEDEHFDGCDTCSSTECADAVRLKTKLNALTPSVPPQTTETRG